MQIPKHHLVRHPNRPANTSAGLEDSLAHGRDFASVYGDLLNFLPCASDRAAYAFRVTNNVITSQTLSAFVAGLYPDVKEYPAWIQSADYDSLEPSFRARTHLQTDPSVPRSQSAQRGIRGLKPALGGTSQRVFGSTETIRCSLRNT